MHQEGQFEEAGCTDLDLGQGDLWDSCAVEERPDLERVVGHAMGW